METQYSQLSEAFAIFDKYAQLNPDENIFVTPSHDQIYAGFNPEEVSMSQTDIERLKVLGWNYYNDGRGFLYFT